MPLLDCLENLENSDEIIDDKAALDSTEISLSSKPRHLCKKSINTGPKGVIHDANVSRMSKITDELEESTGFLIRSIKLKPRNVLEKEVLFKQLFIGSRTNIGNYRLDNEQNEDFLSKKSNLKKVVELDCMSFLKIIENCNKVLILIYDETQESTIIKDCFSDIATRYISIEFGKIFHEKIEMDSAAVPAILGYQDGELVINMIRVIDEICPGKNIVADDLEHILIRNSSFFV
ncbi:hypothetical protein PNEG_01573 [Pneumocystis murina B123]|uniref:Phosducin domain-containing protein n=1 Tax=Pneumocystis murina (strain B123) TaxID=1069680 RepID=M7NTB4_PNEMU|nr:hypothetical protein PNEG_01573 [Pneumocystis murina B123]EMR10316.1 hypothetical protein PNEG_01573 [Pneumocystis murina B123]